LSVLQHKNTGFLNVFMSGHMPALEIIHPLSFLCQKLKTALLSISEHVKNEIFEHYQKQKFLKSKKPNEQTITFRGC